jgi:hypothetical protein
MLKADFHTDDLQHLKALGPGHSPETELPAQSLFQRQFPVLPLSHLGLVQHWTLAGVLGQAPLMLVPWLAEHLDVVTQTPIWDRAVSRFAKTFVCWMLGRQTGSTTSPDAGFV